MTVADKIARTNGPFYRNLFSGLAGLAAAIAFTVAAVRCQDCLDATFLTFSVYVFPLPVAIGLAVGLVAPRKAIVWAPLWACILTALTFALVSGGINVSGVEMSPWRIAFFAAGIILAGLGGLAGELANKHNYAWQSALLVVLACGGMALVQQWRVADGERVFERTQLPMIVAALDRDYIEVPGGLDWHLRRNSRMGLYTLASRFHGRDILVMASMRDFKILGVEYEIDGNGRSVKDFDDARVYLAHCGFREKLLGSLARQNGARTLWCASLEGIRLTLSSTGDVKVEAVHELLKPFSKRGQLTHPRS
ncbi:MAG: hypothetical protein ACYC64_12510 [Armatimonadota bacterium]